MSAPRTAVWLTAIMSAAFSPVAAEANHQTGWQDESSGIAVTADLEDVTTRGQTGAVVAVGQNTATGEAAIYHRGDQGWIEDAVGGLPAGATGARLVSVAYGSTCCNNVALAAGTYEDSEGATQPFVVRAEDASSLTFDDPVTWVVVQASDLPAGAEPRVIALHGNLGLLGTADGRIYEVNGGNPGSVDGPLSQPPGSAPGAINAISMFADGQGYTAGELQPGGGTDRIFKVDTEAAAGTQILPVVSNPSGPTLGLTGIGAATEGEAVAIEGSDPGGVNSPGTWAPTANVWSRSASAAFTSASAPSDLAIGGAGGTMVQAVAGEHSGSGAAWRRTGTGSWTRDGDLSDEPLNGSAVAAGATDLWTVGDGGTALHFAPLPHAAPPNTSIDSGPAASTPDPTAVFTFSSDPGGASFECSLDGGPFVACTSPRSVGPLALGTHTFSVRARADDNSIDLTPATRTVTIVAPDTTLGAGPGPSTSDTTPTFSFFSDLASATFECSLDGAAFAPCTSPLTAEELSEGDHIFHVRAVSSAGTDPTPAIRPFTVDLPDAPCVNVPRPLVRDVVVRKRGGVLVIEFSVAALARVRAKAFHGTELIGRTKERVFKPGRQHTMRLRWRKKSGKPTRLKMSARPAAANACR
jgi:hypothetical protein